MGFFLWFDSLFRFFVSILSFDSLIRFFDSILCFDSLFRFFDSILWFDSLIRLFDSILWSDSKRLKTHWFYCVFAHKGWKTIGFIVFSLKKVEKPLVLLYFRFKVLLFECVLLCFRSHMCKKPYKMWWNVADNHFFDNKDAILVKILVFF